VVLSNASLIKSCRTLLRGVSHKRERERKKEKQRRKEGKLKKN
jgi:heme exporter protein D